MYNLVVNLYYEKDITCFGLNRAKIDKNHNIKFFCNGFQVRGGALKKLRREETDVKIVGVFRVKVHDFTQKKQITESPSYP
jgi:hypothetical protein